MPGKSRQSGWVACLACAVAVLLACSTSTPPPRSCATASECPSDAWCVSASCVANAPPSVSIATPAAPQTNVLLAFDASASADGDPGDSIVEFAWSFRALDGQCTPPVVAGTGPIANVRFACAGRYAVDVAAKDQLGATSTATKAFDVAAYTGVALVTAGPDVSVGHLCTIAPRCTPSGPLDLSASAPGFSPGAVTFAWTVQPPPDRPLAAFRRVTFTDATAATPGAAIETDGEAISGDWIFRVEARDSAGVVGTAAVRVSVTNRAPVVTATVPTPGHQFDRVYSVFTASGEVPYTVSDPDGDPLVNAAAEFHHTGDGASAFAGIIESAPPRVTFSISVPYVERADAARLIGGVGLERTIVFGISDVNGARTLESWPIVVGNRAPAVVSAPAPFTVDHSYDPASRAYLANVPLSKWSDPDGDPLFQVSGTTTNDPHCPDLVVAETVHALCRWPFSGTPAVGDFALQHTVTQQIQDPWAAADAPSSVTFTIGNRAPAIAATPINNDCGARDTCCRMATEGPWCEAYSGSTGGRFDVPSLLWSDPDGDPIEVTVSPAGIYKPVLPAPVCLPSACVVGIDGAARTYCGSYGATLVPASVTDGAATTSGNLSIAWFCG